MRLANICVALGNGKNFRFYHVNTLCGPLGKDKPHSLPTFHAFTGYNTYIIVLWKDNEIIMGRLLMSMMLFLHSINNPYDAVDLHTRCIIIFLFLQNALLQHVNCVVLQTSIWATSTQCIQNIPSPWGWGWSKDLNSLKITLPEAASACNECNCKSSRGCNRCKCIQSWLSYTELCNYYCEI